jgi:hypothetical protein
MNSRQKRRRTILRHDSEQMVSHRSNLRNLLLIGTGLLLAAIGSQSAIRWLTSIGFLTAGLGIFLAVHNAVRRGEIRTNWATYRREDHPLWFRLEAMFWYTVAGLWIVFCVVIVFLNR